MNKLNAFLFAVNTLCIVNAARIGFDAFGYRGLFLALSAALSGAVALSVFKKI